MDDETKALWEKIRRARKHLENVQRGRANLAGILSNTMGMTTNEIEYPSPDTAEVYMCIFGHRTKRPTCGYRLRFSTPMVWIGVWHDWGVKPADIECDNDTPQ